MNSFTSLNEASWNDLAKAIHNNNNHQISYNINLTSSTSSNTLDYKYASSPPSFPFTPEVGVSAENWASIETSSNITFICSSSVILGTTSGYTDVAQNMKITSSSLTFSGCVFNHADLSWSPYRSSLLGGGASTKSAPAPMLTLKSGGTVDTTSMVNTSKINCHGDMCTNQFNLTYSNVTVDGSLTINNWTYGQWPVIDVSKQTHTTLSAEKVYFLDEPGHLTGAPDINSLLSFLVNNGIPDTSDIYSIGNLDHSGEMHDNHPTHRIGVCGELFGVSGNSHYTIDNCRNRIWYYTPYAEYTFKFFEGDDISNSTLNPDNSGIDNSSAHPIGFIGVTHKGDVSNVKVKNETWMDTSTTSMKPSHIPELSVNSNNAKFYLPIRRVQTSSFYEDDTVTINISKDFSFVFFYCMNHGHMASPLVLMPNPKSAPTPAPP